MSDALEALKHFTATIKPDPFDERDVSASWIRKQWAKVEPVIREALEQPSTAEAQARALDEFAKKMRAEAALYRATTYHAAGLYFASEQADAEAKRIREESK